MSGCFLTYLPMTKKVAFIFSSFKISKIFGVDLIVGPSSNVKYAILSSFFVIDDILSFNSSFIVLFTVNSYARQKGW